MNEQLKVIISAEIGKLKDNVSKAKKEIQDFVKGGKESFNAFNDEFQKVGDAAKNGLKVAGAAIVGAATALLALGESTREYREAQAKLTTAFEAAGGSANEAKATYNDLFRTLGDSDKATEAAAHLAKLTTNQKDLGEWTTICQGVYATFGESLPIESLTEAANETAKTGALTGGLADALNWAGESEEAFQAKLDACNTEAEREALIRNTLNGLYSDAASKYEENNAAILAQNEAQAKMTEAMAKIGEVTQPIMTMLTELGAKVLTDLTPYIQEFADKYLPSIKEALSGVGEAIGKVIKWIADNWTLVSTLAIIITSIAVALAVFSTVMGIVNAVMMASPVTWIVMAIVAALAALIAIIVLVIKNWDDIKAATKKCWDAIVNAIKAAIDWVIGFFKKLINFVKENWQTLLGFLVNPFAAAFKLLYDNCDSFRAFIDNFLAKVKEVIRSGFSWIKEKIITPIKDAFNSVRDTFSKIVSTIGDKLGAARDKVRDIIEKIKGFFKFNWSLPKLKVPKFAITPSGWSIGDLLKGSIPKLSIQWNALGGVFDKPTVFGYGGSLQGIGEAGAEAVVPLENNLEWLDKIAGMLANKLGAGSTVVLEVDGKAFGEVSVGAINNITRQTGSLPLVIA